MGLLESSQQYRERIVTKNTYKQDDQYVTGHKNALSDGDEWGKGEKNGNIGGATDIITRKSDLTKNKYNSNNQYDASSVEKQ